MAESIYPKSLPTGMPRASLERLISLFESIFVKYRAVVSPSTLELVAKITSIPSSTVHRPTTKVGFSLKDLASALTNSKDNVAADFENTSPSDVLSSSNGAKAGQAEVVLVGCGAPNRGMGWYHAIQMLEGRYVVLCLAVMYCVV